MLRHNSFRHFVTVVTLILATLGLEFAPASATFPSNPSPVTPSDRFPLAVGLLKPELTAQ